MRVSKSVCITYKNIKFSNLVNKITGIKIIQWILVINEKIKHDQDDKSYQQYLIKVVNRLENDSIETSIDAINDLERLAGVNPEYHWTIINILTNFVRNKASSISLAETQNNSSKNTRILIQAAMTVIGRRDTKKDPENEQIDLSYTDLTGVNLEGANLERINLYQAILSEANLVGANLEGAILSAANLSGANLNFANLSQAILSAANLRGTNLSGANLHRANLYLASLQDAILNDVILDGANLREAKFEF